MTDTRRTMESDAACGVSTDGQRKVNRCTTERQYATERRQKDNERTTDGQQTDNIYGDVDNKHTNNDLHLVVGTRPGTVNNDLHLVHVLEQLTTISTWYTSWNS